MFDPQLATWHVWRRGGREISGVGSMYTSSSKASSASAPRMASCSGSSPSLAIRWEMCTQRSWTATRSSPRVAGVGAALLRRRSPEEFEVEKEYFAKAALDPWLGSSVRLGDFIHAANGLSVEWKTGKVVDQPTRRADQPPHNDRGGWATHSPQR